MLDPCNQEDLHIKIFTEAKFIHLEKFRSQETKSEALTSLPCDPMFSDFPPMHPSAAHWALWALLRCCWSSDH